MHQISSQASPAITTIEVDGNLDVVGAYDLHRSLAAAIRDGAQRVSLDLSRVATIDDAGVRGLLRCCDTAIATGATLTLSGCSRPSIEALRRSRVRHCDEPLASTRER